MKTVGTAKAAYLRLAQRFPLLRKARELQWYDTAHRYERTVRETRVDAHCVMFESFGGRTYACSPRAIFECLCDDPRFDDWTFIWSFDRAYLGRPGPIIPERFRRRAQTVVHGTDGYLKALAKSRYWVQNNRIPELIDPDYRHVYVQCWHGTPFKRLGYDVSEASHGGALNSPAELAARYKMDADKWSYLVSPSEYATKCLCSAFGVDGTICPEQVLEVGYPRNDSIVRTLQAPDAAQIVSEMKRRLGIPEDKKVLLYAPTYREDSYRADSGYTFALPLDLGALQTQLGTDWIVLLRMHYYVSNSLDLAPYRGFAFDVSHVPDVNGLYCIADVLCTDYSSVFFDFANTRRPFMFFWPDYEHYVDQSHGTYLDPMSLPGPKCHTSQECIDALRDIDAWHGRYGDAYEAFHKRFCPHDDGMAGKRVVDAVFSA